MTPDMDEALCEYRELAELSRQQSFDLFVYLRELTDLGAPVLCADIKEGPAITTEDVICHYKLNDGLKALLLTLRARNFHLDKIEASASERRALSDTANTA